MKRLLALLPLVLAACSTDAIEPRSGNWNYGGSDLVSNSCKGDPLTDAAGNFTLTVTGDGAFTVDDDDFSEPFQCTYDGDAFNCPLRAAGMEKVESFDATLFYEVSIKGTLQSETEASGTQTVKLRCEGPSCDSGAKLLGYTLPCEYSYTFSAAAQ